MIIEISLIAIMEKQIAYRDRNMLNSNSGKDEEFQYRGSLKNPNLRGERGDGHENPIYKGDCLKKGVWTVCKFKNSLQTW